MNIVKKLYNIIKKSTINIVYYYILVDLYLLEFFSRRYPYLIFIFSFWYNTFGYTNQLTVSNYVFKICCFLFSWYFIFASIMVYCIFNVEKSKNFFYPLFGEKFVKKMIGNPRIDPLLKFTGLAAAALTVNEVGRITDGVMIVHNGNNYLTARLAAIRDDPYLTDRQKADLSKKTFEDHSKMIAKAPEGTLDRITKVEAQGKGSDALGRIFGR